MNIHTAVFRGSWEGRCLVEGCTDVCHIHGEWGEYPRTPRFFYCASDKDGNLPDGWLYLHGEYVAYPEVKVTFRLSLAEHEMA